MNHKNVSSASGSGIASTSDSGAYATNVSSTDYLSQSRSIHQISEAGRKAAEYEDIFLSQTRKRKTKEYEDIYSIKEEDILHDENFNHKGKVELEHGIARASIELPTPSSLRMVHEVSALTLTFVQYIEQNNNDAATIMFDVFLRHIGSDSDQLARDDTPGDAKETLLLWLKNMLTNKNPNSNDLLSLVRIHLAADYILFDVLIPNRKETQDALSFIIPAKCQEKFADLKLANQALGSFRCEAYQKRGRINRYTIPNTQSSLTSQFGLFPVTQKVDSSLPVHRRGMDLYRVRAHYNHPDYSQYVDRSIVADLPMVCSISTTALRLMRYVAMMTDMSVSDYWDYALPHLSYNIHGGHHTFHEYASILALVGIPYKEGDYSSIFFEDTPLSQRLKIEFPLLFPGEYADLNAKRVLAEKSLYEALLEVNQVYQPSIRPD